MNAAVSSHPPQDSLQKFGLGQLDPQASDVVETHVADCAECAATLQQVQDDTLLTLLRGVDTRAAVPAGDANPGQETQTLEKTPDLLAEFQDHPRYRIVRLLGKGGMGAVYQAEHKRMGRPVALKVIHPELLNRPNLLQRFAQEVKAVSRLAHPNIVQAFDADQAGDLHFLVMEYVEGANLGDYLKARGRLPIAEACEYVRQAALGLQHAHERGMTHRDIKPHNLMLQASRDAQASPVASAPGGSDGSGPRVVKILDFGLALIMDQSDEDGSVVTSPGMAMGTAEYMSPEQSQDSHQVDIRSDIYSLGCTLYHLLAGRPPFSKGTSIQKMLKHSLEQPTPLSGLRPDIPPELIAIVNKMMAKNPANRFQIPAEVAVALTRFTSSPRPAQAVDSTHPETAIVAGIPRGQEPTAVWPGEPRLVRSPRRRKLWPILVAAAAAFVLLGLGIMVLQGVFQVDTPSGPIVIKTSDPDIEITVTKNGEILAITDTKSKQKWLLDTKKLQLGMADQPGGLKIELDGKKPLILQRDGKDVVTVTWEQPKQAPPKIEHSPGLVYALDPPGGQSQFFVYNLDISPDDRYFLMSSDSNLIRVWEVASGKLVHTLSGWVAFFSADGQRIITVDSHFGFRAYSTVSGKLQHSFDGNGILTNFYFSPDHKWIHAFTQDNMHSLWQVETGKELHRWKKNVGRFTADGKHFVYQSSKDIPKVLDLATGKVVEKFQALLHEKKNLGYWWFTQDQKRVVIWDLPAKKLVITDIATGKELKTIPLGADQDTGPDPAVTPDGKRALTVHTDGTLRAWDLATGKEIARHPFNGAVGSARVAISNDGRYAALGCWAPLKVYLWRLPDAPKAGPPGGK